MVVIRGVDPVGLHGFPYETVLARLTPFTDAELARDPPAGRRAGRGHRLHARRPYRGAWEDLAEAPSWQAFCAATRSNVCPPTDDKPFFFNMRRVGDISASTRPVPLRRRPLPAAAADAGCWSRSAPVCPGAIALPLRLRALGRAARPSEPRSYFGAVGLGFMLLETVLIQRFVLFLGFPTYALSVVLFALLVFTGIGSALSARVPRTRRGLVTVLAVVVALVVVAAVALQPVLESLIALPFGARVAISVAVLAPVGLGLGMPMPLGLARFADLHPRSVAYAWGVNGMASVLASVLGVAIAINFGYRAACLVAAGFYALALAHAAAGRWAVRTPVDDWGLEEPVGRPPIWPPSLSPSPSPSPGRRRARAGDVRWWVEDELVRSGYRRAPAPGPVPAPPRRAPSRRGGAPDWPDPAPAGGRVPARAGWDAADRAVSVPPAPPPPPGRGARFVPVPPAPPPASPGHGPRPDGERARPGSTCRRPPIGARATATLRRRRTGAPRRLRPRLRPPPVRPRRPEGEFDEPPAPAAAHLPRPVPHVALLLTPAIGHASTCASTALSDPGTRRSSYGRHRPPGRPREVHDVRRRRPRRRRRGRGRADRGRGHHRGVAGRRRRPGQADHRRPAAPVSDATTVRVSRGEVLVTDGPFTESKEWIAGFDILECDDLDEAIAIAARHPQANGGKLELRPFWPMDE